MYTVYTQLNQERSEKRLLSKTNNWSARGESELRLQVYILCSKIQKFCVLCMTHTSEQTHLENTIQHN